MAYDALFGKTDTLASTLNQAATSATLSAGNFGTLLGEQYLVLDYDVPSKREVIKCTITGTSITSITRAQDGTSDVQHTAGANVTMAFVPGLYNYLKDSIAGAWQEVTETWTRTGNHTFTVTGNVTAKYRKGTKVRYKDGGSYEYGVVGSSSYSAPNTTVTLITNTDYTMAAATITDTYISYIENPEGFPTFFNYTPTITIQSAGTLSGTVIDYAWFRAAGNKIDYKMQFSSTVGGTLTNVKEVYFTLPVNATANNGAGIGNGRTNNFANTNVLVHQASTSLGAVVIYNTADVNSGGPYFWAIGGGYLF